MKKEYLEHVGSMQQLAYVRGITFEEGRAKGLRAYEVKNEELSFQVLADKCLDLGEVSFKGINMNFLSKPGLQGRNHYDTNGEEALRSIMGGFFFTAGLENICAPCTVNGKDYPMHGRIRTTPAEHISADAVWEKEDYILSVSGEMREAELFGENLVLRRRIQTKLGEKAILVEDEIENQSFREEPFMMLYHINMGFPFLDENTELLIPTKKVTPREEAGKPFVERWNRMEAPISNEQEYVFIHEMKQDENRNTMVCVMNNKRKIGVKLEFNRKNLPYFMEWKSLAAGDYVIGLEPSNSSVYGRTYHEKENTVPHLKPFEKKVNHLKFTFLDGEEEMQAARKEMEQINL